MAYTFKNIDFTCYIQKAMEYNSLNLCGLLLK